MYELILPPHLKTRLGQGHPWVYRDQVADAPRLPSGAWVRVRCGGFSAYGLWDAESPIAIRLFARAAPPDAAWVAARVREAWERRAPLRTGATTAYRWLFGEGDGLPGITVDLYDQFAVVATYADSVTTLLPWVVDALRATTPLKGILHRPPSSVVQRLWGQPPPRDLTIQEHGLTFLANLAAGQKTGLFLDQRENRRVVEDWVAGKTVLNCFAYSGGFSVYAARGGAPHVTSVDIAADALADAQTNFARNGFDPADHRFEVADVFDYLPRLVADGRQFDLVILDPPSLARSRQSQHAALRAYTRLNALGLRVVRPGGLLVTSSCTAQVGHDAFLETLAQAGAQTGRRLLILHDAGQPLDHPVPAHFPEGRYLKFVIGQVVLA
ncbi:MAG: class I SAM-dependent rRNA methyltransferase [Anaerolineae bacterium]|nr:class I SAM-dependent rRNA methyltransferase [Anaerolineae bacterium]